MRLASLVFATLALHSPHVLAQEPDPRAMQREIDQSWKETNDHIRAGRWTEALGPCRRMLKLEAELLGERHWDVAGSHDSLATILEHIGEVDEARAKYETVVDIARDYADQPGRALDAANNLADFELRVAAAPPQRERLYAAELTQPAIRSHFNRGRWDDALALVEEQLAARAAVYGDDSHLCAKALQDIGLLHTKKKDFETGLAFHVRALAIRERALGPEHVLTAESLNNVGLLWTFTGRNIEAAALLERSAPIIERERGTDSSDYVTVLENLFGCYRAGQDFESAEGIARKILDLTVARCGRDDRRVVGSLNNLALVLHDTSRYDEAEELLQESLTILRARRRPPADALAQTLANLAAVYGDLGDLARAEPMLREAIELIQKSRGKNNPSYAIMLNNLAHMQMNLGDTAKGIEILRRVVATSEEFFGERSFLHASAVNNLATMLAQCGQLEEAEQLTESASRVFEDASSGQGALYAIALGNQAALYQFLGDLERARELGIRALRTARDEADSLHVRFVPLLSNVAQLHLLAGESDAAARLLAEAQALTERELGARHPYCGLVAGSRSDLLHSQGDHAGAAQLHRTALGILRGNLELASAAQCERQQLDLMRSTRKVLDAYISFAELSEVGAEELYAEVLTWKGSIFARQGRIRLESEHPELAATFAELQDMTNRYAALALAPTSTVSESSSTTVEALFEAREALERRIANAVGTQAPLSISSATPRDLRRTLPPDCALVDYLVYRKSSVDFREKVSEPALHLSAFVVRCGAPIARVELGPLQPIEASIAPGRAELVVSGEYTDKTARELRARSRETLVVSGEYTDKTARELRASIWDPLAEQLGESATVLVSPDGVLGRVPFAALPGAREKTFLIQDVRLCVIAAPHLLPTLLAERESVGEPSLLVVGDVDFDAQDSGEDEGDTAPAASVASAQTWRGVPDIDGIRALFPLDPLPGSAGEVQEVAELFEGAHADATTARLERRSATETAFRTAAPTHRFLHVATHGFFVPSTASPGETDARLTAIEQARQIVGWHPGLHSGIAFAGANARDGDAHDDGLLTALEMATLDLSDARLLVLSACETGLGTAMHGEGLLGLQRAAHISGARAVLAGLWRVDDRLTAALMNAFYVNLWQEELSVLESLRKAQLELIEARTPPREWAAWVLSGDWR